MKKLQTFRAVECPYRENLTSIYRCSSCQFQAGGITSGLECGRKEMTPSILQVDKRGLVFCSVRHRRIKPCDFCVDCFFSEDLIGNVKCMAGQVYLPRRKDQ